MKKLNIRKKIIWNIKLNIRMIKYEIKKKTYKKMIKQKKENHMKSESQQ